MKTLTNNCSRRRLAASRGSRCGANFVWLVLSLLPLFIIGCQAPTPESHFSTDVFIPDPGTANYSTNVLQEGDAVIVTFQYATNFNTVQKISIDGLLNMESVGQVKAAGKTPPELQRELARLYKPQIKDDVVTVRLMAAIASVYVSGAVFRPGKVAMERPMTALEGVMEAGGYDPNRANLSGVTVLRIEDGKQRAYHLNLKKVIKGENESPFYLRPFDIVHVPTKTINF